VGTVTGEQVVKQFGLDDGLGVGVCLLILFGMYFGLLGLAFFALRRSVKKKAEI
jgi:hypothetical protein